MRTALLLLLPVSAHAQSLTIVAMEGDLVPGVGAITAFEKLAIADGGRWLIEVDTDGTDPDADGAILSESGTVLVEGAVLTNPTGATIDFFDTVRLNAAGTRVHNHALDGTPQGALDDSAIFVDDAPVLFEGTVSTATGFAPNTVYAQFFEAWVNAPGDVLVVCTVDEPTLPSADDRALVRLGIGAGPSLASETVLLKEGDAVGTGAVIADIAVGPNEVAFDALGRSMAFVTLLGPTATQAVVLDGALAARQGGPSPLAGRDYELLSSRPLALNGNGSFAFRANLTGDVASDEVIVVDGTSVLASEGTSLPDIAPFSLTGFGVGAPLRIADDGTVLWYGDWDDPDTSVDTGLFLDDQLVLQEGVTEIDGLLIDAFDANQFGFDMSDDGRHVLFEVRFLGGLDAVCLLDTVGPYPSFCDGNGGVAPGCTPCPCGNQQPAGTPGGCTNSAGGGARILASGTASVSGDTLRFELSDAVPSTFGVLVSADNALPQNAAHPCFGLDSGLPSVVLDGLRCVGGSVQRHGARAIDAAGSIGATTPGWGPPDGPASGLVAQGAFVAGQTRRFQAFFRENAALVCQTGQNTSDARRVTFLP